MVQLFKRGDVYTTFQASRAGKFQKRTLAMIDVAQKVLPFVKARLTLPDDVKVVVAFTRSKRNLGFYEHSTKRCFIDPRKQDMWAFVNTMIHELTHAQQYFTGKMENKYSRIHEDYVPVWEGTVWGKYATSHQKYLAQPWEVEARAVARDMVKELRASGLLEAQ